MNVDTILADFKRFREEVTRAEVTVQPIRLLESELCVRTTDRPRRIHRRRRAMTQAYHRRIQKKWVKRFGYEIEYTAYQLDPEALGMPGEPCLVVHPVIAEQLREKGLPAPVLRRREPLSASRREWLGMWI